MRVSGRTDGQTDGLFTFSVYTTHRMYIVRVYKRFIISWCFGTGSKEIFVWRFDHVCHIVYLSFYVTQFGSHHHQPTSPKPILLFRYQFISFTKKNIVIFFMNIWLCARLQMRWRKGVNFPFTYLVDGQNQTKKFKRYFFRHVSVRFFLKFARRKILDKVPAWSQVIEYARLHFPNFRFLLCYCRNISLQYFDHFNEIYGNIL